MATVKLKKLTIIGKRSDLDGVATVCGKTGVFHPENAKSMPDANVYWEGFSGENPYVEPLQKLREVMDETGKKVELLSQKESATVRMSGDDAIAYAEEIASQLQEKTKAISEAKAKFEEYTNSARDIQHFMGKGLDLSSLKGYDYVDVVFGYLPEDSESKFHLYETKQPLHFKECEKEGDRVWGFYLVPSDNAEEIHRIYKVLKFHEVVIEDRNGKPEAIQETLRSQREHQAEVVAQATADLDTFWIAEEKKIRMAYTCLAEKNVFFNAICKNAAVFGNSFVLVGWVPASAEKEIRAELQGYDVSDVQFDGGKSVEKYNPPREVKAPKIFSPFIMFTKMFGTPGRDDVNPTMLMAIIYPILFGIMFGDVGQGACIGILAFILYKKGKLPVGAILVPCSICSVIFGFFYGSVFGVETWLNPIHQAMGIDFNKHAGKFVEVMEAHTSPYIIYFTMGLGVIIMTLCMVINIINKFRRGHVGEALFGTAGICGLAFYLGIAGVLANLIVGDLCAFMGFNFFSLPWLLGMVLAPIVLVFFREPLGDLVEGKGVHFEDGVGNFIMQNIFELIEVAISAMSNIMSFLRVGAFVLVHAGMMQVVFSLAETFGSGNAVIYIIIAVIGNGLISVLECLLVCIQVLRLNYYEMFNRFYLGDGREYEPVDAYKAVTAR